MKKTRDGRKTGKDEENTPLPLQLSDVHSTIVLFEVVAIIPRSLTELWASDHYLREVDARGGAIISHNNVDARTEAKDEPSVGTIQNQITPRQKDLAWG